VADAKSVLIALNSLSNLKNKSPRILEAKEKLCEIEQQGREVNFGGYLLIRGLK
jgi:hypothetical protein